MCAECTYTRKTHTHTCHDEPKHIGSCTCFHKQNNTNQNQIPTKPILPKQTPHPPQIATDARGGVWSLCLHPTIPVVVVGSADQELRVYALQVPEDGAASATTLLLKGLVRRAAPQRVLCCGFAAARDGATVLYAASVGKLVEFFRCVFFSPPRERGFVERGFVFVPFCAFCAHNASGCG